MTTTKQADAATTFRLRQDDMWSTGLNALPIMDLGQRVVQAMRAEGKTELEVAQAMFDRAVQSILSTQTRHTRYVNSVIREALIQLSRTDDWHNLLQVAEDAQHRAVSILQEATAEDDSADTRTIEGAMLKIESLRLRCLRESVTNWPTLMADMKQLYDETVKLTASNEQSSKQGPDGPDDADDEGESDEPGNE